MGFKRPKLVSFWGKEEKREEEEEEEKKRRKVIKPKRYGNYLEYGFFMDHMNFKALYG